MDRRLIGIPKKKLFIGIPNLSLDTKRFSMWRGYCKIGV